MGIAWERFTAKGSLQRHFIYIYIRMDYDTLDDTEGLDCHGVVVVDVLRDSLISLMCSAKGTVPK